MRLRLLFISVILLSQVELKAQKPSYINSNQPLSEQNIIQSSASLENTQMLLGYSPNEIGTNQYKALGANIQADLGYAIYITEEMAKPFIGNKLKAVWFGLVHTNYASNFNVFVTNSLENDEIITSKEVPSVSTGWNKIELDSPVQIDGKGFYIGVTYSISEHSFPFGISGDDTNHALYLLTADTKE